MKLLGVAQRGGMDIPWLRCEHGDVVHGTENVLELLKVTIIQPKQFVDSIKHFFNNCKLRSIRQHLQQFNFLQNCSLAYIEIYPFSEFKKKMGNWVFDFSLVPSLIILFFSPSLSQFMQADFFLIVFFFNISTTIFLERLSTLGFNAWGRSTWLFYLNGHQFILSFILFWY